MDDPPWISSACPACWWTESIDRFLSMVDDPYNCLTLCSGCLNANPNNVAAEIVRKALRPHRFPHHIRNIHHLITVTSLRLPTAIAAVRPASSRSCAPTDTTALRYIRDHGRQLWEEAPSNRRPGHGKYDHALGIQYTPCARRLGSA